MVVFDDDALINGLKLLRKVYGGALSVFDSFLVVRGIKTMHLRMDRSQENALTIARMLEDSCAFDKVHYPGLSTHPGYCIQQEQAHGSGALFSAELSERYDMAQFCVELQMFGLAVSLGGVESLVCHPASMTHESYSVSLQQEIGITDRLLRFSVGVEHVDDLMEDVKHALQKSKR